MSTPDRPDVLVGRKLPGHALWEQLQRRVQPLALEFCSQFFNNELSYKQAQKWLATYGIKASVITLSSFYNSMDMRLRYASLQAAQSAETAKSELPTDLDKATRERIAQHKFELAFMNLSEQHRLQLIQLQQNEDAQKGTYELKKAKLELDARRIALLEKKAAAYDRAQAALETAKKSKGGITPETLKRIESELKLL